ncbi:MAG: septum site-determining protein MinC [Chloroflexi bacterium]|nr:septum site-determining protein MinC [Chloroflexota bacterium]
MDKNIEFAVKPKVQIKGISDGLLIILGEGDWQELHDFLLDQIDQQVEFMRGARVALDVGNQVLKAADLGQLRSQLYDRDITLWAIISNSPTTDQTAQTLGMATRLTKVKSEMVEHPVSKEQTMGEQALLLHRTLRSGFSIHFPGHVVVIGDVNPGAEIVAGGNIIVWGRLKGMAHAGADGNKEAIVCALDLMPTQLRIADRISITPQDRKKALPEIVRLVDGEVVAEPWNPK